MTRQKQERPRRLRNVAAVSLVATAGVLGTYLGNPRDSRAYARPGAPFEAMFSANSRPVLDDILRSLPGLSLRASARHLLSSRSSVVTPMGVPFGLTCDFSVDDSMALDAAVRSSLDDSVICITADIPDLSQQLVIDDTSLVLVGASGDDSATSVTLTADDTRHIYATFDDTEGYLALANITFTGGSTDDSGGSIFFDGARSASQGTGLFLADDTFIGNVAGQAGGAVYARDVDEFAITGEEYVSDYLGSVFEGNSAGGDGGAIFARYANEVVFYGSRLAGNYAAGSGGAVAVEGLQAGDSTLVALVLGTSLIDDSAGVAGGAVSLVGVDQSTAVYVIGTPDRPVVFSGNSAATGGALWAGETGSGTSTFLALGALLATDNTATAGDGGAFVIANDDSTIGPGPFGYPVSFLATGIFFYDVGLTGGPVFSGNSATGDGGAVHVTGVADAGGLVVEEVTTPYLSGSAFMGNTAGGSGGAMFVDGTALVRQSVFSGNSATADGGAIAVDDSISAIGFYDYRGAIVLGGYFAGNTATNGSGGALFVSEGAGQVLAASSTFARNDAAGYGGGIFGDDTVTVYNSTLTGNVSIVGAGAIGSYGDVLTDFTTITDNYTAGVGGGIYASTLTVTNSIVQRNAAAGIVSGAPPANPNPQDVLARTFVDDSFSLFTGLGQVYARGVPWSPGAGSLFATGPVVGALGDNGGFPVNDDTVIPTMLPLSGSLVVDAADPSFTGATFRYDERGPGFPRVVGARADIGAVEATPAPVPPRPTPASPPRNVVAEAGDAEITATWEAPASSGTFSVTNYRAIATIEGQVASRAGSCLAVAPALTCTITGLANGTTYTVRAQALTGAGWSALSDPSESVTPEAPIRPVMVISGTRERVKGKKTVIVNGISTGLVGKTVRARFRLQGQTAYTDGSTRVVDDEGAFAWRRAASKKLFVFFIAEDGSVRSNRVVVPR